jgi:hypothetical protein
MTNAEEMKYQMTKMDQQNKPVVKQFDWSKGRKLSIYATILFIIYQAISILTYIEVNDYFVNDDEGIAKIKKWSANYKLAKECGGDEMNLEKSLQNAVLMSCGYIAFGYSIYVSTLYRLPIM